MSARKSWEYRQFGTHFEHPQDLFIKYTSFNLHHYITELEILLFGKLTKLETRYLEPDAVQERTKTKNSQQSTLWTPQTPAIVQDSHENVSTGLTQSTGIDENGVIFKCQLSGEQVDHVFKIRKDAKGALTLDFDKELRHWPHSLQAFKELDLQQASIHPNYLTSGSYICDLTLERKPPGRPNITSGTLFFQSSKTLMEFQSALTGYEVLLDIQQGITLRTFKRNVLGKRNKFTGRLQIWLKGLSGGHDSTQSGSGSGSYLRRASTSLSTMSGTTFASMATLKAQQAITGSHLTTIDEGGVFVKETPVPPLVIMFVESSSRDDKIQRGQILAFKFAKHSKLDRKVCTPDDKLPRCFVFRPMPCDLEIGRWKFPQDRKELVWLEVTFSNVEEMERFTKKLEDARDIYYRSMEHRNKGSNFMLQDRHNTEEYGAD